MQHPLGRWLLLAVGVWIAGYGLWLLYRSVAKEPEKRLDLRTLGVGTQKVFRAAGRVGVAARGVVFGVIGIWLALAAWHLRPGEAKMPAGALESLRDQPYGRVLLALVAAAWRLASRDSQASYRHTPRPARLRPSRPFLLRTASSAAQRRSRCAWARLALCRITTSPPAPPRPVGPLTSRPSCTPSRLPPCAHHPSTTDRQWPSAPPSEGAHRIRSTKSGPR